MLLRFRILVKQLTGLPTVAEVGIFDGRDKLNPTLSAQDRNHSVLISRENRNALLHSSQFTSIHIFYGFAKEALSYRKTMIGMVSFIFWSAIQVALTERFPVIPSSAMKTPKQNVSLTQSVTTRITSHPSN